MTAEEKRMEKARYTDQSESSSLGSQLRQKRADAYTTHVKYLHLHLHYFRLHHLLVVFD